MGVLTALSRWGGGSVPCEYGAVWTQTVDILYKVACMNGSIQIQNHMTTSTPIQPVFFSKWLYIIYIFVKNYF